MSCRDQVLFSGNAKIWCNNPIFGMQSGQMTLLDSGVQKLLFEAAFFFLSKRKDRCRNFAHMHGLPINFQWIYIKYNVIMKEYWIGTPVIPAATRIAY